MAGELVPEIHDIFKLTTLGHVYSDFAYSKLAPDNETWQGIIKHHCSLRSKKLEFFPDTPATFLLCIADSLASSVSRQSVEVDEDLGKEYGVRKLWKPRDDSEDLRLKSEIHMEELMTFIAADPSKEDYFGKYKDRLLWRSEDSHPEKCITSLYTHSELTGKLYRILTHEKSFEITKKELAGKEKKGISDLIKEKMNRWKLTLCKIKFNFNKDPIRARDLNIFIILDELIAQVKEKFADNFLLRTANEILLISPDEDIAKQIKPMFEKYNFWLKVFSGTADLFSIKPNPKDMAEKRQVNEYFEVKPVLNPPICEICQMAEATRVWEKSTQKDYGKDELTADLLKEDEVYEYLCGSCVSIRKLGSRLPKLEQWQEEKEAKVCWVMLRLDIDQLSSNLDELYKDYLKSLKVVEPKGETKVSFSVLSEFNYGYESFVKMFNDSIKTEFGSDSVIRILDEFLCLRIQHNTDTLKILEIFNKLMKSNFPKFFETKESPIKLRVIISNIKFPFFEIWRILEKADSDVYLSLIGHGEIDTDVKGAESLLLAKGMNFRKSALHNLEEIAKIHESLAKLHFEDRFDKTDTDTYSKLKNLVGPLQLDFRSILTFVKILED